MPIIASGTTSSARTWRDGDHRCRCSGEVEMMQGAEDTAEQEHDGFEHDGGMRVRRESGRGA